MTELNKIKSFQNLSNDKIQIFNNKKNKLEKLLFKTICSVDTPPYYKNKQQF